MNGHVRAPAPEAALQALLANLRRGAAPGAGRLRLKVALCLTKMDRPEHRGHLGAEEAYFQRLVGDLALDNWVEPAACRYFGCSAAGVARLRGRGVANEFQQQDGQVLLVDANAPPIGVLGPIKWLLGLG
jgi:hypothetical protein